MLTADYHTHTIYSHGKGTVEENVVSAISHGIKRIAISDHGLSHIFYGIRKRELLSLRQEIDHMNSLYGDKIEVLMGLEANITGNGKTDIPTDTAMFDCILLGFHKGAMPGDALGRKWLLNLAFGNQDKHRRRNAEAYLRAMDRHPNILAISHPGEYIPLDIPFLAEAAAARHISLEINNAHASMTTAELQEAAKAGATFLLGSDAHRPEHVGCISHALQQAKEAAVLSQVLNWKE